MQVCTEAVYNCKQVRPDWTSVVCAGLDLTQLSIVSAKKCLVLQVGVLILGIDGSLHDAASVAIKASPLSKRGNQGYEKGNNGGTEYETSHAIQ